MEIWMNVVKYDNMEACIENIECPYIVYNGTEIKKCIDDGMNVFIKKAKAA